jgi:hypothetical protein
MINIAVPVEWDMPEIMNTLNAEENAFILTVGSEMIKDARSLVAGLSQKEIYNKIREESKSEIQKLEFDLLVQQKLNSSLDSSIRNLYEKQVEQMKKQIEELKSQIRDHEYQNKDFIEEVVKKEREKYKILLEDKERQINKINETHEFILKQSQKSTSHKGKEGEQVFEYFADESFRDFKGYNLIDKHTQGGAGDFHIQFEEFDVLVDAKNYKKRVPIDQRDKIKKDLIKNEHLTFAWLVSLNTSIDKYDKSPVMYEWINTKQCIVYINNLLEYEDPRRILRIVWFTCKELYKFVDEITVDNEELQELKNDKFKLMDKIRNMRKIMREINTTLNSTRNMLQLMDDEFKEILSTETDGIVESNYGVFDEWWDKSIELTNAEEKILSTDLWFKFKQDNKTSMKEFDVTTDKFKQFLKTKIPMTSIILKSKNANSAFEVKGIKFKDNPKTIKETVGNIVENIELAIDEMNNVKKIETSKHKIIKASSKWSDEEEKKLIEEYTIKNLDITEIAGLHNRKQPGILFRLEKLKLIDKQESARGYDKYIKGMEK